MSLSEKMIIAINEVDMDEIIDFIDEHIKDAYISNHNSTLQGWHQDFLLDEDGDLCLTGHLSTGSMCMSTYEETSVVLCHISSYFEINEDWFRIEDIEDSLNENEKKDLFEKCLNELGWDIEDLDEGYDLYDLWDEENYLIEQIYETNYKEKYNNLRKEYIEADWDAYFRDTVIENVEYALSEITNNIDYYKEDFR